MQYICMCCDKIFSSEDLLAEEELNEDETLTVEDSHGIILEDDNGGFINSICEECKQEISLEDDDFSFYKAPVFH
jgi:hypothetical protein